MTGHPPARPTIQKMPDGSYRLGGIGKGGRVHLCRDLRAWRREDNERTGAAHYVSWSRQEAETYAAKHGLRILEPAQS